MDVNRHKRLTVIRHGKAADAAGPGADRERLLVPKGEKDLRRLQRVIRRFKSPIDLIVTSPAMRARDSAAIVAGAIGYTGQVLEDEKMYGATPDTLLDLLGKLPEATEHVLLIGHNPGLEGLISGLCAGTSSRLNMHLPTAGLAHLALEIYWWQQVRWGCGELQVFISPKRIPKG